LGKSTIVIGKDRPPNGKEVPLLFGLPEIYPKFSR